MKCQNSVCQCGFNQYFDQTESKCLNKTIINSACYSDQSCNNLLDLTCQSFTCQCAFRQKYWSETENKCVNLLKYDEHGCTSDEQCLSSDIQTLACINQRCNLF